MQPAYAHAQYYWRVWCYAHARHRVLRRQRVVLRTRRVLRQRTVLPGAEHTVALGRTKPAGPRRLLCGVRY
eukprot:2177795-Rhodomonas_salina.4